MCGHVITVWERETGKRGRGGKREEDESGKTGTVGASDEGNMRIPATLL